MISTMGIDQHGNTYHGLGKYPRKELLSRLDASKAGKMYRDTADGSTRHVGYIVRGLWSELFNVSTWKVGIA